MDTADYSLDPQTVKLDPRAEVPHLSTPEHLASEAKNPFLKAPACPVNSHPPEAPKPHTPQVAHLIPGSHVPAHPIHAKPSRQYHPVAPHPPKAPTLHNPQFTHLVSGSHAPAHSIHDKPAPHDSSTLHTHTQPKQLTPAEAKEIKAKQQELDQLLDLFV